MDKPTRSFAQLLRRSSPFEAFDYLHRIVAKPANRSTAFARLEDETDRWVTPLGWTHDAECIRYKIGRITVDSLTITETPRLPNGDITGHKPLLILSRARSNVDTAACLLQMATPKEISRISKVLGAYPGRAKLRTEISRRASQP